MHAAQRCQTAARARPWAEGQIIRELPRKCQLLGPSTVPWGAVEGPAIHGVMSVLWGAGYANTLAGAHTVLAGVPQFSSDTNPLRYLDHCLRLPVTLQPTLQEGQLVPLHSTYKVY